jgi:hypothetical protein
MKSVSLLRPAAGDRVVRNADVDRRIGAAKQLDSGADVLDAAKDGHQ